jgi:hypothetical protein
MASQTLLDVSEGGTFSYSELEHMVIVEQTLSEVVVGGVCSYCINKLHRVIALQERSEVPVA